MSRQTPTPISTYQIPEEYLIAPIKTVAYDLEKYLILYVETGNQNEIHKTLGYLSEYVHNAGKSVFDMRSRILEFGSVLTRTCMENGFSPEVLHTFYELSDATKHTLQITALQEDLQQILNHFEHCMLKFPQLRANALTVCKVRGYIARNYASRITLSEIAGYVHLNATYFSSIFKKETGIPFSEYLNRYRIERSKQLLHQTRDSIIDIAIASGFEEQSYYTKMFKKYAGITPAQYRYSI